MTKYSTGGSAGAGDGGACELCGAQTDVLREASIAGATLSVCRSCAPHDDSKRRSSRRGSGSSSQDPEQTRKRRAAQRTAQLSDTLQGDSSHWEKHGTNYDDDPLPYLVTGYGDRVREARENAELELGDLASELGIDEAELQAVEEGRAARAGIGGGLIAALESRLDVTLAEGT